MNWYNRYRYVGKRHELQGLTALGQYRRVWYLFPRFYVQVDQIPTVVDGVAWSFGWHASPASDWEPTEPHVQHRLARFVRRWTPHIFVTTLWMLVCMFPEGWREVLISLASCLCGGLIMLVSLCHKDVE